MYITKLPGSASHVGQNERKCAGVKHGDIRLSRDRGGYVFLTRFAYRRRSAEDVGLAVEHERLWKISNLFS